MSHDSRLRVALCWLVCWSTACSAEGNRLLVGDDPPSAGRAGAPTGSGGRTGVQSEPDAGAAGSTAVGNEGALTVRVQDASPRIPRCA